jgi:NOL1/NOP2/fmu family ribosome biogenesis protein
MKKENKTYFEERVFGELGVSEGQNKITLHNEIEGKRFSFEADIFSPDEAGNIRILPFTLDRRPIQYDHKNATPEKPNINNNRTQTFFITRLAEPQAYTDKEGNVKYKKYDIPKGAGTHPFITPGIIEKFEKKEKIQTLVITEGYFKAFKGYMHGLDIIGFSSITHYKQKETGQMYFDVIRVIKECAVQNIIILYDGDCLNISSDALGKEKDLYTRPAGFLKSTSTIFELLKDYIHSQNINLYFAHVLSDSLPEKPKGLDDILCAKKGEESEVINDLSAFSKQGYFFNKINISLGTSRLNHYFGFTSIDMFYLKHADYIGDRKFIFRGTTYKFDSKTGKIETEIPKEASDYFRVGDSYYEYVDVPNKHKKLERTFYRRIKQTIIDDYGKAFVQHIPKYKAFCNVPDNVNYVQVHYNCFNVYGKFEHEPIADDTCETTLFFLNHIFGESIELGLDYIQLLYQNPAQKLPILCLVSKENSTGKSTFIFYLKELFTSNCTIIGNQELSEQFNAVYATKLIIACEETFVDKKPVIERIKSLATGNKIQLRAMQKDHVEIDFFGKFILASNNEDSFINATDEDIRYWVVKVPTIKQERVNLLDTLVDEIGGFLHFLDNRKLSTTNESRMWFNKNLLKTEALARLIENSRPRIEKEIISKIRNLFFEFHNEKFFLTIGLINKEFFSGKTYEESYITKVLREQIGVEVYKKDGISITKQFKFPRWDWDEYQQKYVRKEYPYIGRPYVFPIEQFLSKKEIESLKLDNGEPVQNTEVQPQPDELPTIKTNKIPF